MKLEIDHEILQREVDAAVADGVKSAFGEHDVRRVIREQVAEKVIGETLTKAMSQAVSQIDISSMAEVIATELMRSTVAAVHTTIVESVSDMVMNLRGLSTYGDEGRKARERVIAEIRKEMRG